MLHILLLARNSEDKIMLNVYWKSRILMEEKLKRL